jgi:hypothetical protein
MATTADALYRTDVFASQEQQVITSSTTTQWADVFARRERRATAASMPEPRRVPVKISVDGEPIEFTYTSFGFGLPNWAGSVLQSLSERWGTHPRWDSYNAKPTNPHLVVKLLNILSDLMQDDSLPPQITPLADSGVQAEWHHRGQDLEIVVSADEEPTYYYFNQGTREEDEGDLDPNYAHVQDLIGRVS